MITMKYFGEKGLTQTSANHLANVAQEVIAADKATLQNLRFYQETATLLSSGKEVITKRESKISTSQIKRMLARIARMNAFCAWVREAIKAKEVILDSVESFEEWKADKATLERPSEPQKYTEADIFAEMSVKDVNEYLTIEAYAATLGSAIHPNGVISNARKDIYRVTTNSNVVKELQDNLVIYSYSETMSPSEIDEFFNELQAEYRENERRLNQIKYQLRQEADKRNLDALATYRSQLQEYNSERSKLIAEYNIWKQEQLAELSKLKIVIPKDLEDTFDELNSLGK